MAHCTYWVNGTSFPLLLFTEEVILNEERTTDEEKMKIIEGMTYKMFTKLGKCLTFF